MALTLSPEQEVIVAEIIEQPLSFVQSVTLTDEQITWLSDDLDIWEAKRNSVSVELKGEVDYKTQRLLDRIQRRVRKLYGLSLYSDESGMGSAESFAIPNVGVF